MNLIFKLLFDTLHHHIYIIVVLMLLLTFCLKIFWRLACWTPSSIICASRFFPFTLVALVLLLFLCKLLLLIYIFYRQVIPYSRYSMLDFLVSVVARDLCLYLAVAATTTFAIATSGPLFNYCYCRCQLSLIFLKLNAIIQHFYELSYCKIFLQKI